jgi:hypothetical protein
MEILEGLLAGSRFDAWRVDIFNPQHDSPAATPGRQPGDQVSAGIANVLGAGR